jgi:hypothetical protein
MMTRREYEAERQRLEAERQRITQALLDLELKWYKERRKMAALIWKLYVKAEGAKAIGSHAEAQVFSAKVRELRTKYGITLREARRAARRHPRLRRRPTWTRRGSA